MLMVGCSGSISPSPESESKAGVLSCYRCHSGVRINIAPKKDLLVIKPRQIVFRKVHNAINGSTSGSPRDSLDLRDNYFNMQLYFPNILTLNK